MPRRPPIPSPAPWDGLRTADDEAGGALRRSGLEEGRQNVIAPRTNRKDGAYRDVVFKIGRSVERIDRHAKWRLGIERFRQRRFLGENRSDRSPPQRLAHHFIGGDVAVLLLIAVGIDAAILSG